MGELCALGCEGLHFGVGGVAGDGTDGVAMGELWVGEDEVGGGVSLVACGAEYCKDGFGHVDCGCVEMSWGVSGMRYCALVAKIEQGRD